MVGETGYSVQGSEARRVREQAALDGERTAAERNEWGQFATPPELAREIVEAALEYHEGPVRFLEPALGSGAFYSALLNAVGSGRIERATGIELDERFARLASELWSESGIEVVTGDYTRQTPDDESACNLLLTNPPYVRHHHLEQDAKVRLGHQVGRLLGLSPSGLSGLYVYFLLLSHQWLEDGGVAAWLIPSEWMSVGYGDSVRRYLAEHVTLLRVHSFAAADVQFDDALVSSTVVFFRKSSAPDGHTVQFTAGSVSGPSMDVGVPRKSLLDESKWARFYQDTHPEPASNGRTVGDYLRVRRGIATGRNAFFIRPLEEWRVLAVPDRFLVPILPAGRALPGREISRGPNGYPDVPSPLALLDCPLPPEEVEAHHAALWAYLTSKEGQAAQSSYLARSRTPWYSQEARDPAPLVCTYMGRGSNGDSPFRVLVNRSDAITRNSMHLLYPGPALFELIESDPDALVRVAEVLESIAGQWFRYHGREYGGGLHKLEPSELSSLPADELEADFSLTPDGTQFSLI